MGGEIPLEARIVAIADVYDSLTCDRPYCPAYPEEWALDWLKENAGSHFDPQVYSAFVKGLAKIRFIRQQFADFEKESGDQFPEQTDWNQASENNLSKNVSPSAMDLSNLLLSPGLPPMD